MLLLWEPERLLQCTNHSDKLNSKHEHSYIHEILGGSCKRIQYSLFYVCFSLFLSFPRTVLLVFFNLRAQNDFPCVFVLRVSFLLSYCKTLLL